MAEPAEENHFFTFRHARQRRIPFVFKDLDIIAPDFLGKVLVNEAIAAHDNAPAAHGPAFAAQRTGLLAQTSNIVNEAVLNITAPAILRDGVWYRQAWDTNLQTTVWEPRP